MYSYGSPHMAAQKQDDQHERTYSSYVRIQVAVLKTYLGRWTIGRSGERGSGISVLPARYDDDDDDLGVTLTQVFTRVRGRSERVTQRCHNSPDGKTGLASANDVTHRKRAKDFGILKKPTFRQLQWYSQRKGQLSAFYEDLFVWICDSPYSSL